MKMNKSVATLALTLGLLAPAALSAKSAEQEYVESFKGRDALVPVPLSVVKPDINYRYAGITVDVVFTVDETGKPSDITVRQLVDRELVTTLTDAVARWQFAPARVEGKAVSRKVMVPFRIVDAVEEAKFVAMK